MRKERKSRAEATRKDQSSTLQSSTTKAGRLGLQPNASARTEQVGAERRGEQYTRVFTVWYRRPLANVTGVSLYDPALTVSKGIPDERFAKVCSLTAESEDREPRLNDVFTQMQGENWSPDGEHADHIERLGLDHTSMSVGDLIEDVDTGRFFQVAMGGFTEVSR